MKRRKFLQILSASSFGLVGTFRLKSASVGPSQTTKYDFSFAQINYGKGLDWNPRPAVARSLARILNARTSVPANPERAEVKLSSPELFQYPFLYLSGEKEFEPFSENEVQRLRKWFDAGGILLADDALAELDTGFDKSLRRELARIFPAEKLKPVPSDHTVFQSYYLLDRVVGRKATVPHLWGIDRGDLTVLLYSQNDLAGAIEQTGGEAYRYPVVPDGETQRELAIRLWVNIIFYALCANYKKDAIHASFISERRKRRPR